MASNPPSEEARRYHSAASYGFTPEFSRIHGDASRFQPGRGSGRRASPCWRASAVHIPDVLADPEYTLHEATDDWRGFRTHLGVPLLREGCADRRDHVEQRRRCGRSPTSRSSWSTTFADQAVIAIENVRLFDEVQARTRELVRSAGAADGDQRDARRHITLAGRRSAGARRHLPERARLCEAYNSAIWRLEGDRLRLVAHQGPIVVESLPLIRGTVAGRSVLDGRTVHIADMQTAADEFPETSANARRWGFRTVLCVP